MLLKPNLAGANPNLLLKPKLAGANVPYNVPLQDV